MTPYVSVVLGSYNRKKFLRLTIDSIRRELEEFRINGEIIVIDGGSDDGSAEWLLNQKDIISIFQHNHGLWNGLPVEKRSWGGFMNLGFKCARGKLICMVSDDCLLVPGALKNGIDIIEKYTADGCKIGGAAFYWRDVPGPAKYWVGSLFEKTYLINQGIFSTSALAEAGYVDESRYQFYYADSDLCLRLNELGCSILLSDESFIEHYSHANVKQRKSNSLSSEKDKNAFYEKWENKSITINPFYSKDKATIEYEDPYKTYKTFSKAEIFNYYRIKSAIKQVIKKVFVRDERGR